MSFVGSRRARRCAVLFAAAASALGQALPSLGATKTWNGGSGTWDFLQTNFSGSSFVNGDDVVFGPTGGTVTIGGGVVSPLKLSFNSTGYTINGDGMVLGAGTGGSNVTVGTGNFARIDSFLTGTNGLTLNGGGSLLLTNPNNTLTGNLTVDGAGSTLLLQPLTIPTGTGRGDTYQIGQAGGRTITLTNGGGVRILSAGWNPDATTKSLVLGAAGSVVGVGAGYNQYNLDDAAQIAVGAGVTDAVLNKTGAGRFTLGGGFDLLLAANLNVNGGVLDITRLNTGSTTAGTRFSALATTGSITVNSGGMFVPNNGTAGTIDNNVTLNAGGVLGTQGQAHEYGSRATTPTTLTFSGGTLLSREAFTPQTERLMRVQGLMSGSGVVDVIGTSGTGNARIVFQGGGLAHTFSGTFRMLNNTVLEANPRYGVNNNNATSLAGSAIGASANLELAGFNSGIDLRDDGGAPGVPVANTVLPGWGNNLNVSTTAPGARPTIALNNAIGTATRNNVFSLGTLTLGGQLLAVSGNGGNDLRVGTLTLTGSPTIDIITAGNDVEISGPVSAAQTLTKRNNGVLKFLDSVNVSTLHVQSGLVELQGPNGAITGGSIIVNGGGSNNPGAGVLLLNNNGTVTGGPAATDNTNRLADTVGITMRSDSTLRLASLNNSGGSETTGNITASFGNPTFDVTVTGTPTAPVALTLGTAAIARGTNTVINFTGTGASASLGTTGNRARIILPGQATTNFLGGWAVSGNEFAKYDAAVDAGFALGVTPLVLADYTVDPTEDLYVTGENARKTTNTTVTLLGSRDVNSLNLQLSAALAANTDAIAIGAGNTLTIESGGILVGTNTAVIDRNAVAKGSITAGTTASPASLYITTNAALELGSVITNNLAGGAVTLVKSGTSTLSLVNTAAGNTFSGGVVVNGGTLNVWRLNQLGAAGNTITLAGGTLNVNVPNGGTNNSVLAGGGYNVVVEGNSVLGADNNGETTGSGTNNTISLGTLTIADNHYLGIGGFDNYDFRFTGAAFANRPTINLGIARGGEVIIGGNQSGGGFDIVAFTGTASTYTLGNGIGDTTANTYSGAINLYGGTLRLNKANGTTALTGDLVINGGTLAWGPGGNLTNATNLQLPGGLITVPNHGRDNIADTANITLLTGTLGVNGTFQQETFGSLTQRNGTFNPGIGTINIGTYTISGGTLSVNSSGTLIVGTMNVEGGAPNIDIANNFVAQKSILQIGSGGLTLTGQDVNLATGTGSTPTIGADLLLGGNVTVNTDPLNAGSYVRGILVTGGRELANNVLDLSGGNRTFNIAGDAFFRVSPRMTNGGIVKTGAGVLSIQNFLPSNFAGPVAVNDGVLLVRSPTGLGTSAGGVTVANGATLKIDSIDSGVTFGDNFTLSGPGAVVVGSDGNVREQGALVAESGTVVISGGVAISGDTTLASISTQIPQASNSPLIRSNLRLNSAGGVTGTGNLTLGGFGDGEIANGVNIVGGLNKTGGGTWSINGASSYAGQTSVQQGVLVISNNTALGTVAGGTTVTSGGVLRLAGNVTSAEPLDLGGLGRFGAVHATGGTHNLSGNITLSNDTGIRSDTVLTLGGTITSPSGRTLYLGGDGGGTVGGSINTGTGSLVKLGAGTWTVSGGNSFSGSTTVTGGDLVLNYAGGGSRLSSTSPLVLAGGDASFTGGGSQTVSQLAVNAGGGSLTTATTAVNLGAVVRTAGGSVNFSGNAFTTSSTNTNGLLGGYATFGGNDFATVNAGTIAAFTGYTALPGNASTTTDNHQLAATQTQTAAVTANSLKISGGAGLHVGTFAHTLSSGGLLYSGGGQYGIAGSGIIGGATTADDLIVHVTAGGTLDIGTPLIGAGAGQLVKAGEGTLILTAGSAFTGNVNINGGVLAMGGGDTVLGANPAAPGKLVSINNGGTLRIITGDYDPAANSKRIAVGAGGGTIDVANGRLLLNDAGQVASVNGTLTKTGGGRVEINLDNTATFLGDVVVNQGSVVLANANALGGINGGTITINGGGSAVINAGGTLVQPFVINGGALHNSGGDRTYTGNLEFSGNSTIGLVERDNFGQNRSTTISGRVSGSGTINLPASSNGSGLFLLSGANDFTGIYNLTANGLLEARIPGALGTAPGQVTVNLNGANGRFLLRHYLDGNYNANVNVNGNAELGADRPTAAIVGTNQFLAINNLSIANTAPVVTVSNGNGYTFRVAGTTTVAGSPLWNATGNLLLDNGATYSTVGASFEKIGAGTVTTLGQITHSGPTVVRAGGLWLRGTSTNPLLPNTSAVEVRGGTLTVDNSDGSNRLGDSTPVVLNGGTLRISGPETLGTVSATQGNTNVFYNQNTQNGFSPLTLTGFAAPSQGASINFQSDFGTVGNTVGSTTNPRIYLGGIAANQAILGWATHHNNDLVQYMETTTEFSVKRGVAIAAYTTDPAETAFSGTVIGNFTGTTTTTLGAARTIRGVRLSGGATRVIDLAGFNLTVASGAILHSPNNTTRITGGAGILTAGTDNSLNQLTVTVAQNTLVMDVATGDNGATPVALVKGGPGTLSLRSGVPGTALGTPATYGSGVFGHTGGTFINAGTVDVWRGAAIGDGAMTLAGGTLLLNIPVPGTGAAINQDIPIGNTVRTNVIVTANSILRLDNNAELADAASSTDNNMILGGLTIDGPHILQSLGFQSYDAVFQNGAVFTGTPIIDMVTNDAGHTLTLAGAITGTGGYTLMATGGGTNGLLEIGGGASDTTANTNAGPVTVLAGNNPILQLNKAPGTTAIAGNIVQHGGTIRLAASNQIADTSNLTINGGTFTLNANQETIANITMNGGTINTGTSTTLIPTLNASDVVIRGSTGNGLEVSSATGAGINGGRINITNLTVTDFGKVVVGGLSNTGAAVPTLDVTNVNLTGTTIFQNSGAGSGDLILRGTVTTFAADFPAAFSANDTDAFLSLEGIRTFDIADGPAPIDMLLGSSIRNNGASVGGIIKTGPGTMLITNSASVNYSFTGSVTVNQGVLALSRTGASRTAIPADLVIGDGVGGARADILRLLVSDQIANTSNVTIGASGLFDMQTINTSEAIASLNITAGGEVDMGPNSILTLTSTTVSSNVLGAIVGNGSVVKQGAGTTLTYGVGSSITYTGTTTVTGGTLVVNAITSGQGSYIVQTGATLGGSGTIGMAAGLTNQLLVQTGGTLRPGNSPGVLSITATTPGTGTASTLAMATGTTLSVEINGTTVGTQYDQVDVTGTVDIAGGNILLALGYTPAIGDAFTLIANDGVDPITGAGFATLNGFTLTSIGSGQTQATDGTNIYTLTYTGNFAAGISDPTPGSGNDLVLTIVPEPTSIAALALAGMGLLARRRRRA